MKHLLLIDPLEKLNPKKDSSLMLATSMKSLGMEVFLLFEKDFYLNNKAKAQVRVYDFASDFYEDGCYLKKFELTTDRLIQISKGDTIHMRIDPPFDTRYLRYLWMLRYFQESGIKIVNSPDGILKFNEKLHAYTQSSSLATYVGSSSQGFQSFVDELKLVGHQDIILKPLDLYQGIGVEKLSLQDPNLLELFSKKVKANQGAIVAQPFCAEVISGEIRSIYFKGKELGSILKVPKAGEFLANIAQGANFHAINLSTKVRAECDRIANELMSEGVDWIAYDIMGEHVSEINITCPGLLVEVSYAHQKNLALELIKML